MKKLLANLSILALLTLLVLPLTACVEEEGPLEKAGKKADDAIEETQEGLDEVGDEIQEAAEDTKEELQDDGDSR
jgi:hypothetical protein